MLEPVFLTATTLPDAWFQALWALMNKGRRYTIDKGSYEGQDRLELDATFIHIKNPSCRPLLPEIPPQYNIPNPVEPDYLDEYLPYLMTTERAPEESYTYGTYIVPQMEKIIKMYKEKGYNTNQAYMTIGDMSHLDLDDPACLRGIDTRISYGKLHFFVYFRSNDLWNGFPANLAALQLLKEYMASEIGVEDGEMVYSSKGLHIYDYVEELAKMRIGRG